MTQTMVLKKFFELKPGETLGEFKEELKALTAAEKQELAEAAARALGIELDDPSVKTAA